MFKKYVKLLFLVLTSTAYVGCEQDPYDWTEGLYVISAENIELTDVSTTSAKLSFDLKVGTGVEIEKIWVECKLGNYTKPEFTFPITPVSNGRCEIELTELSPNSGYNIEIYATTIDRVSSTSTSTKIHSRSVWLQTLNLEEIMPNPTTLKLTPATDSSDIYAECALTLHDADSPIIEAGFYYGISKDVTFETGKRITGSINNTILFVNISNLDIDTYYYIGAYVISEKGTLTTGTISTKTNGFGMDITVKELIPRSKGFSIKFYLDATLPYNASIQTVVIKAARPAYLELYGFPEGYWDLSSYDIVGEKTGENIYTYNILDKNLTGTWVTYKTEYLYWFSVKWIDANNKEHETNINRKTEWKFTTL